MCESRGSVRAQGEEAPGAIVIQEGSIVMRTPDEGVLRGKPHKPRRAAQEMRDW